MRKQATFIASILLLCGFAAPALAYDVSYSSSTPTQTTPSTPTPLTCPANAYLNGDWCYCNSGYKVSATSCVKDEAMPAGTYEIYDDVLMTVTINDDRSCSELGITGTVDMDMCKRYIATPKEKRDQWKSIPRPSVSSGGIANPWAPPSQQTLANGASSQTLAPIHAPPPPPPPPTETPKPEVKPEETPAPTVSDAEKEKIGEALKEILDDRSKEKPVAKKTEPKSTPEVTLPSETAESQIAKIAEGPPQELVELSKRLAAAAAVPAVTPTPENTRPQTAPEPEPEKPQGFFARVFGFFSWLF